MYGVKGKGGSANVRLEAKHGATILKTLPNGSKVQIAPDLTQGNWLFYTEQGTRSKEPVTGFLHKSQLQK